MATSSREKKFLEDINQYLPGNIDWKRGAVNYLDQLMRQEGEHNEIYHLIKPFLGGPEFGPFFAEMYGFLNILQHIELPMNAKVLDVACGPGWTSHYLAKLGYDALGIDISPDLIAIANKRAASEPFPPYVDKPLSARFVVHDIEEGPLDIDTLFDAAFFESALHHFYDPIAAITNVSKNLSEDGILCIWEGIAPEPGSPGHNNNIEIMTKYHTLERPYTRQQLVELLEICGFSNYECYSQVNGLFNMESDLDANLLNSQLAEGKNQNICIASRSSRFFERKGRNPRATKSTYVKRNRRNISLFRLVRHAVTIRSQDDFLTLLYNEILHRRPDPEGLAHYKRRSDNILSRLLIIYAFISSSESKNIAGNRYFRS